MKAPVITIDMLHSEVLTRPPEVQRITVTIHLNFDKPVKIEDKTISVRFRLVKDTTLARTTASGVIVITADTEDELKELEESFRDPNKPPLGIAEYIVLRLQPLILLTEDYMGIPPIPVTPPAPQNKIRDEARAPGLYQ